MMHTLTLGTTIKTKIMLSTDEFLVYYAVGDMGNTNVPIGTFYKVMEVGDGFCRLRHVRSGIDYNWSLSFVLNSFEVVGLKLI